ncbi:MAG TPA: outer membrane protein transport protein [Candidatus Methanoperedens sp.]|nr:outer membrane protein transport protein [Candidatus Methanoperedens sp.]
MKSVLGTICAAALLGAIAAAPAGATNGMDMIGYGARSIGMGGADVAVDGDASAAAGGNPAVVAKAAPSSANLGLTALMPVMTYRDPFQEVDGKKETFWMPSLGYVHSVAGMPWAFGVGAYAQGGMGVHFGGVMTPAGTQDQMLSEVGFLRVNPLASYKVNDDLSLGASVMIGYAKAMFNMFPKTPGMNSGLQVQDLASLGYAAKVGAQYCVGPKVRLGATYTTQSAIDLDGGTATLNFGPGGLVKYDAELKDFTWPQEVEAGVAYLPVPGLTIAADVKWINWSSTIDTPKLKLSSPGSPVPPGYETMEIPFDMGWDDQLVFALGAEYVVGGKHALRAGVNYGKNPVPAAKLNPLFPAIPETHLTLGYGLNLGKWSVDAAYEHAFEKSQKSSTLPIEIAHSQNTVSLGATYRY